MQINGEKGKAHAIIIAVNCWVLEYAVNVKKNGS